VLPLILDKFVIVGVCVADAARVMSFSGLDCLMNLGRFVLRGFGSASFELAICDVVAGWCESLL
jgi:hypothetical protein